MNALRVSVGWGLGLLLAVCAHAATESSASIYTCVDAAGRRITADRPIAACIDREQRELSPTGTTRRVIGPTLTQHERAQQAAMARKAQNERDRIAEERRRERVLVTRYPNQNAHDDERAATLETSEVQIKIAQQRLQELRAERKNLNQEMEFYRRDPAKAPVKLQRSLADNDLAADDQRRQISAREQEMERINQRFDAELEQLRALWEQRQVAPGVTPGIDAMAR